jgi:hypothetical protein
VGKHVVVRDGLDPLTKPILDYLERVYGMPATDVKSVALDSEVGQVQLITVTVMVRQGEPVLADSGLAKDVLDRPILLAHDGKPGCPVTEWDGPFGSRCSQGWDVCARHGGFDVTEVRSATGEEWIGPSSENPVARPDRGEDITQITRPPGRAMPEDVPTWRRNA